MKSIKNSKISITVFYVIVILFIFNFESFGQEIEDAIFERKQISIARGIGCYSVKDEFISTNTYSGVDNLVLINWLSLNSHKGSLISFSFSSSDKITNNNISSSIKNISLSHHFLFSVKEDLLFSKPYNYCLGPYFELYVHLRNLHVANPQFNLSFASLISLGLNNYFTYYLSDNFSVDWKMNFSLLSVGIRLPDMYYEENISMPVRFLPFYKGLHWTSDFGFQYAIKNRFILGLSYYFDFTRMSCFDPFTSLGDYLVISGGYRF